MRESDAGHLYAMFAERQAWSEAEQFLEFAAAACTAESAECRLLDGFSGAFGGRAPALYSLARRTLAAECSAFLRGPLRRERWIPYNQWVVGLGEDDTVISFNYDTVLEELQERFSKLGGENSDDELTALRVIRSLADTARPRVARALKLHGSVDWILSDRPEGFEFQKDAFLHHEGTALAIGTPGPGKFEDATTRFSWLWNLALGAVREATELILLGYRFPETDGYARAKLVRALQESHVKNCRVVLGTSTADATRVVNLLRSAAPAVSVVDVGLKVEEFIGHAR